MSWSLRLYWLKGSLHYGVDLIRRFPSLKSITLEVRYLCLTAEDTSGQFLHKLQAIVRIVLAEFKMEKQRDSY